MTRRRLAPLAFVPLLVLAACGGSDSNGSGGTTAPAVPADVTIRAIDGIAWDAKSYTATSHDGKVVIRAENDSSIAHNLYVVAPDGTQEPSFIDLPQKGSSGTETLSLAPGSYTVICKIPGHSNMKASLVVS